jgi:hypothetical protein
MNPHRISSVMRPILEVLIAIFVVTALYTWLSSEDYEDDEFTVTITYDCKRVLTERDYPTEVLGECLELRDELTRKNK